MSASYHLRWVFLVFQLLVAGFGTTGFAKASENIVCTAEWRDGGGIRRNAVLEKQCEGHGSAAEKCTGFHVTVDGIQGKYTDTESKIQKEDGYLVFKPYAISEFSEMSNGEKQQRLVISFIDNSGSPSRAEEGFQIIDSGLKPITPLMNIQEAGDELQRRRASVAALNLNCTSKKGVGSLLSAGSVGASTGTIPPGKSEIDTLPVQVAPSKQESGFVSHLIDKYGALGLAQAFSAILLLVTAVCALIVFIRHKSKNSLAVAISSSALLGAMIVLNAVNSFNAPTGQDGVEPKNSSFFERKKISLPNRLSCDVQDFPFEWEAGTFHFDFDKKLFMTTKPPKMAIGEKVWSEGDDRIIRWISELDVNSNRKDVLAQAQIVRLTPLAVVRPNHFKVRMVASGVTGEVLCLGANEEPSKGASVPKAAANPGGTFVRPGGWICDRQIDAVQYARMRRFGIGGEHKGCMQVGAPLPVRVLQRTQLAGTPVVNVGNSGGAAWTIEEDLQ